MKTVLIGFYKKKQRYREVKFLAMFRYNIYIWKEPTEDWSVLEYQVPLASDT